MRGRGWWAAFAAAVAVQLAVLYAPTAPSLPGRVRWDLLVHAAVFGLVAWTGRRAGLRAGPLVAVLLAHAVVSEIVQAALLPNRTGSALDALADAVGTLIGAWLRQPHAPPPRRAYTR